MKAKVSMDKVIKTIIKLDNGIVYFNEFGYVFTKDALLSRGVDRVGVFKGGVNKYRKGYKFTFYLKGRNAINSTRIIWHTR